MRSKTIIKKVILPERCKLILKIVNDFIKSYHKNINHCFNSFLKACFLNNLYNRTTSCVVIITTNCYQFNHRNSLITNQYVIFKTNTELYCRVNEARLAIFYRTDIENFFSDLIRYIKITWHCEWYMMITLFWRIQVLVWAISTTSFKAFTDSITSSCWKIAYFLLYAMDTKCVKNDVKLFHVSKKSFAYQTLEVIDQTALQ